MPRVARPYQIACRDAVRDAFRAGKKGVVVEAFTGFGKGFVIADIANGVLAKGKKVLILVNRDNLTRQLTDSLSEQGMFPQVERGQDKTSVMSDCVIGSIQTMQGKRLQKWPRDKFQLVITDEVHGSAAGTFKATLDHFESAYHLGMTATAERHDKKGLWRGYEDIVFTMTLQEGVDEGWLVPFEFKELPVPIVISDEIAKKKMFTEEDETGVFEKGDYLPRLFAEAAGEVHQKHALFFWPNCKSSEEAAKAFNLSGVESRHISGYLPDLSIAETLEWFKQPGPKSLHNADLLSVGYDNPMIDCVGIMRLSRSLPMLKQRIGRGTRALCPVDLYANALERRATIACSAKPTCLVIDLMIQLGDVKNRFADVTALITDNEEERKFLSEERAKSGAKFTAEELEGKLKMKRKVDEDAALARLAEDAANAAQRAQAKKFGPYLGHITNKPVKSGWKPASTGQIRYLGKLGYHGIAPSGWHASRIIDAYLEHRVKQK